MLDLPAFLTSKPAPAEWQRRLQALDPDLWMAWNPLHVDGPRWCVVRHLGALGRDGRNQFIVGFGEFGAAIQSGEWSYVRALEWPDGSPAELADMHILHLFRDDFRRRLGTERGRAKLILADERAAEKVRRDVAAKKGFGEAYESANSDRTIVANATSVVMSGGGRK